MSAARGIVIGNVFSDHNRGGAALTAVCIRAVQQAFPGHPIAVIVVAQPGQQLAQSHGQTMQRFPDVELLPPAYPAPPGRLAGLRATLRSLWAVARGKPAGGSESLRRIAAAELVVSRGGYIFVDRQGFGGLLALWHTAFPIIYASRLGIPTVVFSSSIGPFRDRKSRMLNRWILRRATLVLARDPRSYRTARVLGVPFDRVREVPDSVFALDPPTVEQCREAARRHALEGAVGVVTVRSLVPPRERDRFLDRLAEALGIAIAEGLVDRIAVVDQLSGGEARDSADLLARLPDDRATLISGDLSPTDLMSLYGSVRFVVGCRLHSTIFAMIAGTPAVVVSLTEEKAQGIFESLGLAHFLVEADFRPRELVGLLHEIVEGGAATRARVATAVGEARQRVQALPDLLEKVPHRPSQTSGAI
ncbi:MAG: polysaccharide pyruvyl transferase family protein [Acidimicrobiia bacterium]